jgi:anti-anti-sigma factor
VGGETIAQECYKFIDEGFSKFVLNLKDSNVVNSVGISILIEIMERLEEVGGKIIFTHLDPAVEKTFTIMGLFQFAEKAGNDDDAVKQFA